MTKQERADIAVVIPAFNAENTIAAAIKSASAQTVAPSEIVVVDDGSADRTAAVAEGMSDGQTTLPVKVIRQKNQGAAVARQTGTEATVSQYVAYLDADDWWPYDKLAVCREILVSEPVDFLLADLQRGRPGTAPESLLPRNSSFFPWATRYVRHHGALTAYDGLYQLTSEHGLALLLRGFPVYPSTMVVRRAAIEEVSGWDGRFRRCQDFDLGLRLARRYPLHYFHRVQAILGLHEVNEDGVAYSIKQTHGDVRVLRAHFEAEPVGSDYRVQVARALSRKLCGLGYLYRQVGDYGRARAAYREACNWPGRRLHAASRWALSMRP
jgi:glycosyltransferase involved in cell wall biosynthesis